MSCAEEFSPILAGHTDPWALLAQVAELAELRAEERLSDDYENRDAQVAALGAAAALGLFADELRSLTRAQADAETVNASDRPQ